VDIDAAIKEVMTGMGPPGHRASYGQHVPLAWIIRGLVERGHLVSESVRTVVAKAGLDHDPKAVGSVRAAYYRIRDKEWPAERATAAATHGVPQGEPEDFEV
jgi:hypothetical protein